MTMSHSLRQWARDLRKKINHGSASRAKDEEVELPYLHAQAPVSFKTPENSANGATDSALFTRLPHELRRMILVAAFGARTVHMHLRLDMPLLPRAQQPPLSAEEMAHCPHGGVTADITRGPFPTELRAAGRRVRSSAPGTKPAWQWWGCVCHRNPPPFDDGRMLVAPWADGCVRGEARFCRMYSGEAPDKCFIGCTGWLTACRQAYAEGLPVLYGTNTLFIESQELISALLQAAEVAPGATSPTLDGALYDRRVLVPPQHVAQVTKLEILWKWNLFLLPNLSAEQATQRAEMAQRLELLPQAFPQLASLYISYEFGLCRRQGASVDVAEIDEELLLPLCRMVRRLSNRRATCTVELPWDVFLPLRSRAMESGSTYDEATSPPYMRFWWQPEGSPVEAGRAGLWVKMGSMVDDIRMATCF